MGVGSGGQGGHGPHLDFYTWYRSFFRWPLPGRGLIVLFFAFRAFFAIFGLFSDFSADALVLIT